MASLFIENALNVLPLPAWIVIIFGVVVFVIAYAFKQYYEDKSGIDSTSTEERLERLIVNPTEKSGAKTKVFLHNEATENKTRNMGVIVKSNSESVLTKEKEWDSENSKVVRRGENNEENFVEFTVLTGNKIQTFVKYIAYNLIHGIVSNKNSNSFLIDTFFLEKEGLYISDRGIVIKHNYSLYKKNGVWRLKTRKTQEAIQEITFLDAHEDTTESFQELADIYSSLNVEIQGKKRMLDAKWENIADYKSKEEKRDKEEAMES